jgi:hypothetical protein
VLLRPRKAVSVAVAALALAAGGLAALATEGRAAASEACAAATHSVLAAADAQVLGNIYANELAGQEVSDDLAEIAANEALLAAVSQDDGVATLAAVKKLVYHPAWHIVRLRVLDASGRLLADFGGPYVIAPVSGVLRSASGALIGSFVMSVQDDVGVTKLEQRFVGDPIAIYAGGRLVAQLGAGRFPRTPPSAGTLALGGVRYLAVTRTYNAFPSGTLRAVIFVPPPAISATVQSCSMVRAAEFGRVAARLTGLLGPVAQHYYGYAYWVHVYTAAKVFVLDPAGTVLASSDGSDPPALPLSGSVTYEGQNWLVFSFEPQPPVRVFLLVPPG